ncbi:MAG: ABC transporter permease [Limnochordia bacterium]|jgi:peptide/nickel transport system permease protein
MFTYILRRTLLMIPTLFLISVIAFAVIDLPPGDYLTSYVAQLEAQGAVVSEEQILALQKRYALDQPAHVRYLNWIWRIVRYGDFGQSWNWNRPVRELLAERLPFTIGVSVTTLVFTYLAAIPIGIYSAVRQYSWADYIFTTAGFLGLAVPNFLLALVLMYVFYRYFGVSIGGMFSPEFRDAAWSMAKFRDLLNHLWVPIIVIGTSGTASLIRTMRGVMLDELGKDYVQTARAKGLSEIVVIVRHAARVAVNPIISVIGWTLPQIISGEAIVAIVLNLPTTGPLLYQSLLTQDMYLAGSFIFILSALTVIGTLLSDILLAWIDPRIRFDREG